MQHPFKPVFWAAATLAFVMAVLPQPPHLPGAPSDKIQHIAAFLVLGVLGGLAYRRVSVLRILFGLSCFGALIEVVQMIPVLHRDADVIDWVADTLSAGIALLLVHMWRRLSRKAGSGG
jgi:VanZ family protein